MRSKDGCGIIISLAISGTILLSMVASASAITYDDLATFGLTLDEFNTVRSSESPNDFGGLASKGEQDQLWWDATDFEYEVAMSHADDKAFTSSGYHPYLICSTAPGLSGTQREENITLMFQTTPGVSASHFYTGGNLFINNETISCGVIRAFNDTIYKVYDANPTAVNYMSSNPLHPSMKMAENTVEILESWFDAESGDPADIITTGGADDTGSSDRIQVNVMGLLMVLCPGVQEFGETDDVPDDQIATDILNFVTEDGGNTVKELSFYHHRVNGMDGDTAVFTERMNQWSEAITKVNSWTNDDGSNLCLDNVITDTMVFQVEKQVLEVNSKLSFWEADKLVESLGMTVEDSETCIWYMTYGLALSPLVCAMETKTKVKTLCSDGTSDLSQCPVESSPPPPTDNSSNRRMGGANYGLVNTIAMAFVVTVLVANGLL
mmetsp:Transcript_15682/g.33140  ORF Transcript_15682/g.33140 Transcript_15682/m.33140 type:complete len:437 (-) Transcript_15682:139-1449(-)|eukprot:CAMPEP_0183726668 /NCGR_PEP_ID=MMETSP0737-20130205/23881_1 /TAXON_ID=385413 /ORGANISM="Thalassiosira miniscula, Strain CCMP1093" /LENGTH=436 /DNA_ID=CAMNT_0025958079 /DNA_START=247 /DNA_END=1557 /DNA_ORIENTATION=-